MAIAIAATQQAGSSFAAGSPITTVALTKPGSPVAGDYFVLFSQTFDSTPSTMSCTGFTNLFGPTSSSEPQDMQVMIRKCDGSEGATFTVNWSASTWNNAFIALVTGVDPTTAVDDVSIAVGGPGTTITYPVLTTTVSNAFLMCLGGGYDIGAPAGQATGMTQISASWTSGAGGGAAQGGFKTQAVAGSTGSITQAISSDTWVAVLLALRPSGGAVAASPSPPAPFGPGPAAHPRWQWVQQHGIDAGAAVQASNGAAVVGLAIDSYIAGVKGAIGAAKATVADVSRNSGTKGAIGAAKSAVADVSKEAGSKTGIGTATSSVTAVSKTSGVKGAIGAAVSSSTVESKTSGSKTATGSAKSTVAASTTQSGVKTAVAAAKSAAAVFSTAIGTAATGAVGAAKAAITVFARVVGSKVATGTAKATVAVDSKQAGVKTGVGAGVTAVADVTKTSGSKSVGGSAKAAVAVGTKQSGVRAAFGAAKASIAVVARAAAAKAVSGAAKAALAVYSKLAGTQGGAVFPGDVILHVKAPTIDVTAHAPTIGLTTGAASVDVTFHAPTITLTISAADEAIDTQRNF